MQGYNMLPLRIVQIKNFWSQACFIKCSFDNVKSDGKKPCNNKHQLKSKVAERDKRSVGPEILGTANGFLKFSIGIIVISI